MSAGQEQMWLAKVEEAFEAPDVLREMQDQVEADEGLDAGERRRVQARIAEYISDADDIEGDEDAS